MWLARETEIYHSFTSNEEFLLVPLNEKQFDDRKAFLLSIKENVCLLQAGKKKGMAK